MPFIIRDANGKIIKASARAVAGAEALPHDHPEILAFLAERGQNPQSITDALAELRRTDGEMARAVEDVMMVLMKKNLLKMTDLPKPVQDRMAFRVKQRMLIEEAYEYASSHAPNATPRQ